MIVFVDDCFCRGSIDLINQNIYAKFQFSKGLLYWMDVVLSCVTAFRLCCWMKMTEVRVYLFFMYAFLIK